MDTAYVIENGLRRVWPYYFEYKTSYKPRWANLTVKQVLCSELGQDDQVVEHSVKNGKIWVTKNNGRAGGPVAVRFGDLALHRLQPHDIIYNSQHMHEPPVAWARNFDGGNEKLGVKLGGGRLNGEQQQSRVVGSGIGVLYENDELVVVNKPGGVATHPGGIYRLNTLSEIVKHELGHPVWPCHRLDKPTLGIVVFGKTQSASTHIMKILAEKGHLTRKEYVARVQGDFPYTKCRYTCPVFTLNSSGGGYVNVPNGSLVSGDSSTIFEKIRYLPQSDESIVACQPISGKMHQIRVHLRNLGFPISNDPIYCPESEVNRKKNGIERKLYARIFDKWPQFEHPDSGDSFPSVVDVKSFILEDIQAEIAEMARMRVNSREESGDRCGECGRQLFLDEADRGIYLHARKLAHEGEEMEFAFETGYPDWCEVE